MTLAPLPAPDYLELTLPEGHVCLLTDDGGPTTPALAGLLAEQGWRVALLNFPADVVPPSAERALPAGVARVTLPALAEADLQAALAEITAQHGPVGAFIHLHPALPDAALFDARERALVKAVFLLAKHLHPALTGAAKGAPVECSYAAWLTVTRLDGALGFTGAENASALAGGLAGLTKSLRLEWSQAAAPVFCRALDLAPALAPEQATQTIWAELHDPNRRLAEVGVGEGGRVTPILDCGFSILDDVSSLPITPYPSSLFLVSGGAKGITAQCVIAAARRYGGTYLLLGSSPAGPEPDWCAGIADEAALKQRAMEHLLAAGERPTPKSVARMARAVLSQREIAATLRAVEAAGGRAVYICADVTDAQAVRSGVEAALRELAGTADALPRITGIIHGAGVIADKPIHQKTADDFEWVYGVKVDGLQNLLACVPPGQLEHLLLFSSVAGFYGNVGQADYALANEVLNKLAHRLQREHPTCRVRALDWGPWDGGMVTPELKRLLAQRHIEVIPPEAGTEIFVRALADDAAAVQQVVGGALIAPAMQPQAELQTHRLHRRLTLDANPFLRDHVIGGQAVLPTVCAVAWVANAAEQLYPGYTFFRADDYRALKGIVFDETLAADYALELTETAKSPEEIAFAALIQSATADGKPRFHYRVNVTLRRELPAPPRFDRVSLDAPRALDGATLYTDGTLFHGPAFRGVERVLNLGPEGLTMRCRLPQVAPETQGQFPVQSFNPYLTDVELQSLLIWAKQTYGYGGLPLKIQGGAQYRPVAFGETVYVSLTVQASSERQLVADVTVYDAAGLLYSQVEGAEITLSPRLNNLFAQNRLEARV